MRLVVVDSPFAGDLERNARYLDACLADCYRRGESPYASHAIGPRALTDADPEQRRRGIEAGFAYGELVRDVVFYCDLGWSRGMRAAADHYYARGVPMARRFLGASWSGANAQADPFAPWPPDVPWQTTDESVAGITRSINSVRVVLGAALRELDEETRGNVPATGSIPAFGGSHVWGGRFDCASHNEGLSCCLDPRHENFDEMLAALAARVAARLPAF